jgi:protoporphyrinogen oxidase
MPEAGEGRAGGTLTGVAGYSSSPRASGSPASGQEDAIAVTKELPVGIVGAGFAGLVAARRLRQRGVPVVVFEGAPQVGGLARSFTDDDGFTHDFGAHFITNRLASELGIADQCRIVRRHGEAVFLDGRTRWYPYGLALDRRYAASAVRARLTRHPEPAVTAGDEFRRQYGEELTREVIAPLIESWSGEPIDALAPAAVEKLPGGLLQTAWLFAAARITRRAVAIGYSREKPQSARVWHVYPMGGLGTAVEHLLREVEDSVRLESPVESVIVEGERVRAIRSKGEEWPVAAVFSTAPVHVLPRMVSGDESLAHLARFRYRPMVFVNLRLDGRNLLETATNWFPEPETPFFRVSEATVSMPWLAPEGKTILTADYGCAVGDDLWTAGDEAMAEMTLQGLERHIPDVRRRYLGVSVLKTPLAYPIFLNDYEPDRQRFAAGTGIEGLYSIGRNGEFAHILLEDVYWRTLRAVDTFLAGRSMTAIS